MKVKDKLLGLKNEMIKISNKSDYSDFGIFNPRLIYIKYRQFLKNSESRLYEGAFQGLLFENYVTNILIKASTKLETIDWFIHISQPKKKIKAKELKGLNCLSHDNDGSIILFRDGYNHAEFDGILSINNQIVLLEMKNIGSSNTYPIKKLDSRINKFTSAFKINSLVLAIFAHDKFSTEYKNSEANDPDFDNFYLPDFDRFLSYFKKNHQTIRNRKISLNSKSKIPNQVFAKTIKYQSHMNILWNALMKNKKLKPFDGFWSQVHYSAKLIGKQAVGYLDPNFNITTFDLHTSSKYKIQDYLRQGLVCVIFVRFNEPVLRIELVVCEKRDTKRIHRVPEAEFSYDEMQFTKIRKRLAEMSINYKVAMNFKKEYPNEIIDSDKFEWLLERCLTLSNFK